MNDTSTLGSTVNKSSINVEKLSNSLNGVSESQSILGNQKNEGGKKVAFDWNNIPWKSVITLIMFICVFIVIYPRLDSVFGMIHQVVGLPAAFINLLENVLKSLNAATDPTDPHFWGTLIFMIPLALASPILGAIYAIAKVAGNKSDPDMEKVYETTGITEDEINNERIEKIKTKVEEFKSKENREPTKNEQKIMEESVKIEQYERVLKNIQDGKPSAENAKEVVNRKIQESTKKKSDAEALDEREREKRERERETREREKREREA
jgi:hypothetical protein